MASFCWQYCKETERSVTKVFYIINNRYLFKMYIRIKKKYQSAGLSS